MTKEILLAYIHRRKAAVGTWQRFADELGVDIGNLHRTAEGKREPSDAVLSALKVRKSVKETFTFVR